MNPGLAPHRRRRTDLNDEELQRARECAGELYYILSLAIPLHCTLEERLEFHSRAFKLAFEISDYITTGKRT